MSAVGRPLPATPGARGVGRAGYAILGGAILMAALGAQLASTKTAGSALALVAVVVSPIVLWRRPALAPVAFLIPALTVEQSGTGVSSGIANLTNRLPVFQGIGGAHLNVADGLIVLLGGIWLIRYSSVGASPRRVSPIGPAMLALVCAVVVALGVGFSHGGDTRIAMLEIRPYVYLAGAFLLVSTLVDSRRAIRIALWTIVLGSGLKAFQGLLIFLAVRNQDPRPEAVLGHEEALFFGLFLLLTAALWLFEVRGPLRRTATILLPIVIAADLGNSRRTAWLVLGAGALVLIVVGYARVPSRRRFLRRVVLVLVAVLSIYLPAYWNKTGGLAQPARAIHSFVQPDVRDASSDLYRQQENANLAFNIREGGVLGRGFGVHIDYVLPITDISDIDPFIGYIPHNGVYYVMMRLGVLGAIAFWSLLGVGLITGCRLLRVRDRELAALGAVVICALVAYALQGYNDQGFFFFRIAIVIGTLLGLAEAALRIDASERATEPAEAAA